MPTRALIVLLVVLNLGVAAWWLSQPAQVSEPVAERPRGVASLQLLSEAPVVAVPAPPDAAAPLQPPPADAVPAEMPPGDEAPPSTVAAAPQCLRLGPFADAPAAEAAIARLAGAALRSQARETRAGSARGYAVLLPPAPDRAAAQAMAQRIGAAGFDDFLVIGNGEQANGIALGRYRSRDGAERRQAALRAAGFPAQLQALGDEGASQWWADVAVDAAAAARQLRAQAAAAQARPLDCATVR